MKGKTTFFALAAVMLFSLPWAKLARGTENPSATAGKVYALEEVSVSDCTGLVKARMQSGQATTECGGTPHAGVSYPAFKSKKPIYGVIPFDVSLFDPQAGLRYHFALDESAGAGYDRLYFDANHDSDLTNDSPVGLAKNMPTDTENTPRYVLFENVQVKLDYGPDQGRFTQTVIPRLMKSGENTYMFFAAPTARKGKIALGSQEVELVLGQAFAIAGRYDRPMTCAFLSGMDESLPFIGYWRCVDGTFYRLLATPAGDKVTVTPYAGPFGILETDAGEQNIAPPIIEFGWIHSRNAFIDISDCPQKDGTLSLPVGDYRPFRLAVRCGQRRIGLAMDTSRLGQQDAPAVFPIAIRENKPFVFDFSGKLDVVFKSPTAGDRLRPGQTLKVEAMLYDVDAGIMISAIEDTTKKTGSAELNGRNMDMFESVAPTVKITNASGRVVAEGPLPFG